MNLVLCETGYARETVMVTGMCSVKKGFLKISQNLGLSKEKEIFPVNFAKLLRTSFL